MKKLQSYNLFLNVVDLGIFCDSYKATNQRYIEVVYYMPASKIFCKKCVLLKPYRGCVKCSELRLIAKKIKMKEWARRSDVREKRNAYNRKRNMIPEINAKRRAYTKKWLANPENIKRLKEVKKRYSLRNKDRLAIYHKKWKDKNKDYYKEQQKAYKLKNNQKLKEFHNRYMKIWRSKNKYGEFAEAHREFLKLQRLIKEKYESKTNKNSSC